MNQNNQNKSKKMYLILTVLFSLLFIMLLILGSYLLSIKSKQFGVAAFLFAFGAAFGQMGCLAMYMRHVARDKAMKLLQNNPNNQNN